MRRRRRSPVGAEALKAIIDARRVYPDEVFAVLSAHGWDVDGTAKIADLLAQVQADKFPDLSPRRRERIKQYGAGLVLCAVALALEAEAGR